MKELRVAFGAFVHEKVVLERLIACADVLSAFGLAADRLLRKDVQVIPAAEPKTAAFEYDAVYFRV